jgi:BioD-like phosphotransacetylase family protein
MTIESALKYLRRAANKAVITGGDRADMTLTALESGTSVLILTGGLYPDVSVLSRASEKKVPVILVPFDTFTAIDKLHDISRRLRYDDEQGIRLAKDNVAQFCQWQLLLSYLSD